MSGRDPIPGWSAAEPDSARIEPPPVNPMSASSETASTIPLYGCLFGAFAACLAVYAVAGCIAGWASATPQSVATVLSVCALIGFLAWVTTVLDPRSITVDGDRLTVFWALGRSPQTVCRAEVDRVIVGPSNAKGQRSVHLQDASGLSLVQFPHCAMRRRASLRRAGGLTSSLGFAADWAKA
jgi:hypothetical protein